MSHLVKSQSNGSYRLFISAVILTLLSLQFLTSFRLLCLGGEILLGFSRTRVCDPSLWPFLSYPMYSPAHYPGEKLERTWIYAILEDKTEKRIQPRELGFSNTQFFELLQSLETRVDQDQVLAIAEQYRLNTGQQLIGFRLEKHPLVFGGDRFVPEEPLHLKTIWVEPGESE